MKITVNTIIMKETFINWNCDHYSWEGCETLLNYYNEIDENMEFNPLVVCCDCSEFGNNCALSFGDMLSEYGYLLENEALEEMAEDEKINKLVELLKDHTTVLSIKNGNYIVFNS